MWQLQSNATKKTSTALPQHPDFILFLCLLQSDLRVCTRTAFSENVPKPAQLSTLRVLCRHHWRKHVAITCYKVAIFAVQCHGPPQVPWSMICSRPRIELMKTYRNRWKHMETYGNIWKHMETYGNIWKRWHGGQFVSECFSWFLTCCNQLSCTAACSTFEGVWNSFRIFFLNRFGNFFWISWLVPFAYCLQRFGTWICHFAWYLPHLGMFTFHFAWDLLHVGMLTFHCVWYLPHFGMFTFHFAWDFLHAGMFTFHFVWYLPHFGMFTFHFAWDVLHVSMFTQIFTDAEAWD